MSSSICISSGEKSTSTEFKYSEKELYDACRNMDNAYFDNCIDNGCLSDNRVMFNCAWTCLTNASYDFSKYVLKKLHKNNFDPDIPYNTVKSLTPQTTNYLIEVLTYHNIFLTKNHVLKVCYLELLNEIGADLNIYFKKSCEYSVINSNRYDYGEHVVDTTLLSYCLENICITKSSSSSVEIDQNIKLPTSKLQEVSDSSIGYLVNNGTGINHPFKRFLDECFMSQYENSSTSIDIFPLAIIIYLINNGANVNQLASLNIINEEKLTNDVCKNMSLLSFAYKYDNTLELATTVLKHMPPIMLRGNLCKEIDFNIYNVSTTIDVLHKYSDIVRKIIEEYN